MTIKVSEMKIHNTIAIVMSAYFPTAFTANIKLRNLATQFVFQVPSISIGKIHQHLKSSPESFSCEQLSNITISLQGLHYSAQLYGAKNWKQLDQYLKNEAMPSFLV